MFDKIFKKPPVLNSEINKSKKEDNCEKDKYNPRFGDANRYENAQTLNRKLAEEINQEAKNLVLRSLVVLEDLENNPEKANFHSDISGRRWNIHYLDDAHKELQSLYGVYQFDKLSNVPDEVISFVKRFNSFKYKQ